ncbi:MAG TPA: DUF6653 family protein [Rubrobacteraceae bacterium]|nr:DUF6653 family protein [Rubrobacteraceae bacterium]
MSSLIKRLARKVFRHHSNPWSAWSRLLSVPLVFVPIWTRSWRLGAIVGAWLIVNPIVFPEPKDDKAWATRAMLGEEMWIAERPLDRAMALNAGATAFGLGGVLGAYKRRLLPTSVCTVGQVTLLLAYWREMVDYYERHREERA